MKSISLELLRHGDAHNQLLSPLTQYMALCGTQPMTTFTVPYEHRDFLRRLGALRYDNAHSYQERTALIRDIQNLITDIFKDIEGLRLEVDDSEKGWLHLRLVVTPNELAMLPFELARAPALFPGAGLPLLLNPERAVTLTREIRQASQTDFTWPVDLKVLLVSASPSRYSTVPTREHALALRQALDPWTPPKKKHSVPDPRAVLRVLEDASLRDLQEACREEHYTHVHILAHGAAYDDREGFERYGLAFHADDGVNEQVVPGEDLANAIRCLGDDGKFSRPAVVTLASCQGGDVTGGVLVPGGSVAHSLHTAGVPFVVASQFPLTYGGSATFAKEFYTRVLRGDDPRRAMYPVRQALKACHPECQDWASLVAYDRLPVAYNQEQPAVALKLCLRSMEVAQEWGGAFLASSDDEWETLEKRATENLDRARRHILRLLGNQRVTNYKVEIEAYGLLGSVAKRRAEMAHYKSKKIEDSEEARKESKRCGQHLRNARDRYFRAMNVVAVDPWTGTQYLSLSAVLGRNMATDHYRSLWTALRHAAEHRVATDDPRGRRWSRSNLIELYLLRPLTQDPGNQAHRKEALEKATQILKEDVEEMERVAPELLSTRKQLLNYSEWFKEVAGPDSYIEIIGDQVKEMLDSVEGSVRSE